MNSYTTRYKYRTLQQTRQTRKYSTLWVIIPSVALLANYVIAQDWYYNIIVVLSSI